MEADVEYVRKQIADMFASGVGILEIARRCKRPVKEVETALRAYMVAHDPFAVDDRLLPCLVWGIGYAFGVKGYESATCEEVVDQGPDQQLRIVFEGKEYLLDVTCEGPAS